MCLKIVLIYHFRDLLSSYRVLEYVHISSPLPVWNCHSIVTCKLNEGWQFKSIMVIQISNLNNEWCSDGSKIAQKFMQDFKFMLKKFMSEYFNPLINLSSWFILTLQPMGGIEYTVNLVTCISPLWALNEWCFWNCIFGGIYFLQYHRHW